MPVSKSVPRPASPPEENASMKQGIVTILRSDPEKTNSAAASIRRTLSADMSSKNWLEQNGMKKIASFKELFVNRPDNSSSEGEEDDQNRPGHEDIWKSIQLEKEKNVNQKSNMWCALVKSENSKSDLPPPYVHPLVKRSASTLSKKSLEICTESLGSETGSDCFSSYPGSEFSDEDKEERHIAFPLEEMVKGSNPFENLNVVKYNMSPVRPFPPPIPSIVSGDGASLHMHSKRENGRLVLEAVSVPSRKYFQAQRQDGRLVLTLVNGPNEAAAENEEVFDNMEEVDEVQEVGENLDEMDNNHRNDFGYSEDEDEEEEIATKNVVKEFKFVESTRFRMINIHKTGLVMKKLVAQGNKSPTWSKKMVNMIAGDEGLTLPQSLPPLAHLFPPPPASAGSFNAYDYFWRKNTVVSPMLGRPMCSPIKNDHNNKINCGNQDGVIIKEKKEKFAPYLRDCKDGGRSLLVWEPYCIATS